MVFSPPPHSPPFLGFVHVEQGIVGRKLSFYFFVCWWVFFVLTAKIVSFL